MLRGSPFSRASVSNEINDGGVTLLGFDFSDAACSNDR